jgi:hypothetical protein
MKREYKVRFFQGNTYEVIEIITTYGERTSAYDSEPDTVEENKVYQGELADCAAYIRLHEDGIID